MWLFNSALPAFPILANIFRKVNRYLSHIYHLNLQHNIICFIQTIAVHLLATYILHFIHSAITEMVLAALYTQAVLTRFPQKWRTATLTS